MPNVFNSSFNGSVLGDIFQLNAICYLLERLCIITIEPRQMGFLVKGFLFVRSGEKDVAKGFIDELMASNSINATCLFSLGDK